MSINKKNQLIVVAALLLTSCMALSGAALAQDFTPKVRARIPFNFYAGGKILPAGTYTLSVNRVSYSVAIFQRNSGVGTFLHASQIDGSHNGLSLLTFRNNAEGTYVLVKAEGPDLGLRFSAGNVLSHVALDTPANQTQVVVADAGN